ncbi:hypothetical protein GSI_02724 [Ganoderma sinense ZZ0214-1]|uniref:FAD-binding PCMH-type domain-containing protein n=1 Tax=Ganoderma sinense ZZ0214-1 TaxID=1077348 RepID=A0A2G8SME0_9APHY|nr:hypothetical protein GSI_02724 [Ganoderma sinense ZZ0214-1]
MLVVRRALPPVLLFSLLGFFNPDRTSAVAEPLNNDASSLSSAFAHLNAMVGGRLNLAVPFEQACFSVLDGQHANASAAACADLQANYTDPLYRVTHFSAYMFPQWETCQSSLGTDGCLLDSTNPSNPLAFEGMDCRLGNVPPYYITVRSAADVQAALAFSNTTGVRLSVKNKGHDFSGRSSGRGTLALWTTELRNISYNAEFRPEGCSANTTYDAITTGAGVLAQDVYAFADSVNRTIIGGYHQTVGFSGGYLLGGGHSILSPVYGLAVDRVVEIKVVTPDGVFRTANECQNQDLFFALRGGGGPAFGVVIEATHRTEPQLAIQAAVFSFNPTGTDLADWYSLTIDNALAWVNDGWGGHIMGPTLIYVNPLLNTTAARASMQSAIDFVSARNGTTIVEELPTWLAFFEKYVITAEATVGYERSASSRLLPSRLFTNASTLAQLRSLVADVLPFANPYIIAGTPWLYEPAPGAAGATSVTPAWRDAVWHLLLSTSFEYNDTLAEREGRYRALSAHIQGFRDLAPESGSYFNEGDVYEPDHEVAYWGAENYEKLLAVKRKYDPDHLLDCWRCVGWKGEDDDLYQCHIKL